MVVQEVLNMSDHLDLFFLEFSGKILGPIYVIIEILKIYLFKSSGPCGMRDKS